MRDARLSEWLGHGVAGISKRPAVSEQRRDVFENDASFREVRHIADETADARFQLADGYWRRCHRSYRETENGFGSSPTLPTGSERSSVTWAEGGPRRTASTNAFTVAGSPAAASSTLPVGRLRTHPDTPRRRASSRTNQRKPTPWTRPSTSRCTTIASTHCSGHVDLRNIAARSDARKPASGPSVSIPRRSISPLRTRDARSINRAATMPV